MQAVTKIPTKKYSHILIYKKLMDKGTPAEIAYSFSFDLIASYNNAIRIGDAKMLDSIVRRIDAIME